MTYDQKLERIQGWILSTLTRLGVFAIPIMPASFLGYAIYKDFLPNEGIALWFCIVCSFVIEEVGIILSEIALRTTLGWQNKNAKWWMAVIACIIFPLSSITTALVIYYSEGSFSTLSKGLGVAGSFMAMFVYIGIAINRATEGEVARKLLEKAERKAERILAKSTVISSDKNDEPISAKEIASVEKEEPSSNNAYLPLRTGTKLLPRPDWMDFVPRMKFEFIGGIKDGRIRLPAGIKAVELAKYVPVSARSCQDWLNEIKNGEAYV